MPRDCKRDGRSAGVEPALATGRAALLQDAVVTRLHGTGRQVSHVTVRHKGRLRNLRARGFVLAAGGLGSPRLLLASASEDWPQGCANESGLVGRGPTGSTKDITLPGRTTPPHSSWCGDTDDDRSGNGTAGPNPDLSNRISIRRSRSLHRGP